MNDEMRPKLKVWFPVFRVTTSSLGIMTDYRQYKSVL